MLSPPPDDHRVETERPSTCAWCGSDDHATAACDADPPGACPVCGEEGHRWAACDRYRAPSEAERRLDPTLRDG